MILARRFLKNVQKAGSQIVLEEWRHVPRSAPLDGWTYHAKGIWITPPLAPYPVVTLIGSSNFTRRSDRLDLESTCVVVTRDEGLQRALEGEVANIREFTGRVGVGELDGYLAEGGWRRGLAVRAWVSLVSAML
jgi:CDP-diacylglycerol---glycerol-3-phosphate 3-phosphatidyltransferase